MRTTGTTWCAACTSRSSDEARAKGDYDRRDDLIEAFWADVERLTVENPAE